MPNFAKLFAEAIAASVRDHFLDNPEIMTPGYWLIRLCKGAPVIPARTYFDDHMTVTCPYCNDVTRQRRPLLYKHTCAKCDEPFITMSSAAAWVLLGEIAGEPADPIDIFGARDRQILEGHGQFTPAQEYAYQSALVRHAQVWEPDSPLANPRRRVKLTNLPPIPPPGE